MFNSRHTYIAVSKNRSPLCVNNPLCQRINNGLSFNVYPLYLVASVFGCRIECNCQIQSCMQPFSAKGKTAFQCCLF